jgi:hypothetical protein
LRDVRVLRDKLLAGPDWNAAATSYASEHDRYYMALHRIEEWRWQLFYSVGPEADATRAFALSKMAEDPSRAPDFIGIGPDAPHDEAARRRFFGED